MGAAVGWFWHGYYIACAPCSPGLHGSRMKAVPQGHASRGCTCASTSQLPTLLTAGFASRVPFRMTCSVNDRCESEVSGLQSGSLGVGQGVHYGSHIPCSLCVLHHCPPPSLPTQLPSNPHILTSSYPSHSPLMRGSSGSQSAAPLRKRGAGPTGFRGMPSTKAGERPARVWDKNNIQSYEAVSQCMLGAGNAI